MKTLILITFFAILLFPLQILSQIDDKFELDPYRLLQERVNPITKQGELIKESMHSQNLSDSKSRTIINKKILDNGFLLIEEISQIWDGSAWVNNWKLSYTYDGNNNRTEELGQSWDGSAWVNSSKSSYTYDGDNNQTEALYQTWDGSAWVNFEKYSYTYDGNNNLTEELYQTWDGSNWVNMNKSILSYIPTGIEQFEGEVSTYSLSNNYPNPFNPSTTIKYQIPELSIVTLKVFDILGNEIETLVNEYRPAGRYETEFNAANLPSGVYFYQLKAGEFISTKKMVLIK